MNIYGQTGEKFDYELNKYGNLYIITLKSEKPISKDAKYVLGRFLDEQWLNNTYYSIVEKSINSEKMGKLTGLGGHIDIRFSVTGKVLGIRIYILKENLEILNESDLYTLYCNLHKSDMDMSKIEIEYSQNWVQGTEAFWGFVFSLKRKQK